MRTEPIWKKPRYRDFTGGENLKVLPEILASNQIASAQNCIITDEGLLETREGKAKINTTSLGTGPIISAHRYTKENGSKYILAQHGTSLYAHTWDGSTPFTSFGTAIKTGLNGAKLRSRVWKDKLILTNGVDQPFTFDGSTCTDIANAPKSKVLEVYAGRLWVVDVATGFLENSNLEDYTVWTESGSYKVRDGDGDSLAALCALPGGLVLFKQNTVQTLYGTNKNNISISEPHSRHIGCAAVDSVLNDGFFLGKDNFYTFDLNSVTPLPQTHTPVISALTPAEKAAVFAMPHPIYRRALVNMGDSMKRTLCIDAKWNGAITSWANLNASCFTVADDKDDPGTFVMGDATNGYLFSYGGTDTDDGNIIETRIKSIYLDHDSTMQKEWSSFIPEVEALENATYRLYYTYDVDFAVNGGMLTESYVKNFLTYGQDKWNMGVYGVDFRINDPYFLHDARGNRISFELVCLNRIRFNGFTTKYRTVGAML